MNAANNSMFKDDFNVLNKLIFMFIYCRDEACTGR